MGYDAIVPWRRRQARPTLDAPPPRLAGMWVDSERGRPFARRNGIEWEPTTVLANTCGFSKPASRPKRSHPSVRATTTAPLGLELGLEEVGLEPFALERFLFHARIGAHRVLLLKLRDCDQRM